jgi:hypothetical protein
MIDASKLGRMHSQHSGVTVWTSNGGNFGYRFFKAGVAKAQRRALPDNPARTPAASFED